MRTTAIIAMSSCPTLWQCMTNRPVEVAGLLGALRARMVEVTIPGTTADIAGTGGDGTGAVNISTVAAIVAEVLAPTVGTP